MIRRNLIANFLGQGWTALMGLAFIPFYIKYLGIEAYGLIGIFAVMQAWMVLLDVGMTPTLGREMARFTGGAITAQQLRDLLRSIEILTLALVVSVSLFVLAASHWIAVHWLNPDNLSINTVSQALAMMGLAAALRFGEGIYRSSLMGLQHQVLFNAINASIATLRALGAVAVLAFISPAIQSFFLWQAFVSVLAVVVMSAATYKVIPSTNRKAKFSIQSLKEVWRFAAGMMGITLLALLLTQIDKVLLSKMLSLEDFGFYSFATVVAMGLFVLTSPITQTFYPRFCALIAAGDKSHLAREYHAAAQLLSVLAGSAALVLILFAEPFLRAWTQNSEMANRVAPLLSLLVLGNLLNGLMWLPYQAQLAYGWTSLTARINVVAVLLIVPALLWVTPRYGAEGAAWVWACLNAGYLLVGIHFMYRRILKTEKWSWYVNDILKPLGAGLVSISAFIVIWPIEHQSMPADLIKIAFATLISLSCSALAANHVRWKLIELANRCSLELSTKYAKWM